MLNRTFCHLPGVGPKTERAFWARGVTDWHGFLAAPDKVVSRAKKASAASLIDASAAALAGRDAAFFGRRLPSSELWRLFPDFRDSVAYLDIETTGLGSHDDHITTIALYDGERVRTYVHGRNLAEFEIDVAGFDLVVTYNGKCFDIPFIERTLGFCVDAGHIDLRWLLHSLGIKGGLKGCEKHLGLDRAELDGVDGFFAVVLWNEFERTRDERVLETLLAYNAADVISLELLVHHAFNAKLEQTPFSAELALETPREADNPFRPDIALVERLKSRLF